MNVGALRKHLSDLASFLDQSDGGKAASGIRAVDRGLEPFSQYKFEDFAAFLGLASQIADEFRRTGQVPVPPGKAAPSRKVPTTVAGAAPKPSVAEAKSKVRGLYEAATKPGFPQEKLDELKELENQYTSAELKEIAAAVNAAGKLKSGSKKSAVIDAIRQSIWLLWKDSERAGK